MSAFLRLASRTRSSSLTLQKSQLTTFNPTSVTLFEPQHQHQQRGKQRQIPWYVSKSSRLMTGVAVSLIAGFLTTHPCMVTCSPEKEEKEEHITHSTQQEGYQPSHHTPANVPPSDDTVTAITSTVTPFLAQMSFGGVLGYSAGYATRTVGRIGLLTVGLGFIGIQTLAYNGYIDVKWKQIEENVKQMLDQNGDGELNEKDLNIVFQRIMSILRYGLPSSAGFGAGFLYGIRG